MNSNRRNFLANVGRGMFVASVGSSLAMDMRLISPAFASEEPSRLSFGAMDSLVDFLQSTPVDKLLPLVVEKIRSGTTLRELTGAAALANARAFGGEDYIGFHTLMALGPALTMANEMSSANAALPVLKVLYRNSSRLQEVGAGEKDRLEPLVASLNLSGEKSAAEALRKAVHEGDRGLAAQILASSAAKSPQDALNDLLPTVEESADVHRVVLMHRAWDMLPIVGEQNALAMLRQSLGYCLKNEVHAVQYAAECRAMLPKVMDQFKLESCQTGTKEADDRWIDAFVNTLFTSSPVQAAEAIGAAISEGMHPKAIAEAISLTANQLVLRDAGRSAKEVQPGKPEGSVHGDSIGVHASDSANAWRNIAMNGNLRNKNAALVLGGYQVALDRIQRGGDFANWQPRPLEAHVADVKETGEEALQAALKTAVEANDQNRACAVVAQMGMQGCSDASVKSVLREYAISQDGALHAEKYYRTTSEDFALTRPSLRWRHLISLARVTASEYGRTAPGHAEACDLLAVK